MTLGEDYKKDDFEGTEALRLFHIYTLILASVESRSSLLFDLVDFSSSHG